MRVQVDSYRFLPRSFRSGYELAPTDEPPVWTPFAPRLADATVALLSSAGLSEPAQPVFDVERERREPTWGDPSHRIIGAAAGPLAMRHLHVNDTDILADPEIALPRRALDALVEDGVVGRASAQHVSVMGYQGDLTAWRTATAPAIVEHLRDLDVDGVVLAPV